MCVCVNVDWGHLLIYTYSREGRRRCIDANVGDEDLFEGFFLFRDVLRERERERERERAQVGIYDNFT